MFVQQRGHNNFFTPDKKLAKIFGHKKNRLWTKIFYETYGITYPRNMDTMLKSDNIRGFVHESLLRSHLTPIYRHCDLKLIIPFGNSNISKQLIHRVFWAKFDKWDLNHPSNLSLYVFFQMPVKIKTSIFKYKHS